VTVTDANDSDRDRVDQAEEDRVARRYREARDAGWPRDAAHAFSLSELDIGKLRALKNAGCPGELAAGILL
jgi:hypothetical protein